MKIVDYEKVQKLSTDNVFLLDGESGTKGILAGDLAKALIGLLDSEQFMSGVNLSELPQINALSANDKILVGTATGNKAIASNDVLFAVLDEFATVEMRRNIFRGKNLGPALTAAQKAEIKAGTFKGFFVGDYWTVGDNIWRIVDINYWLNCGDTSCTTPHLVIMPDAVLYNAQMNETNITTGGYVGSKMYTTNLENAKTLVNAAFGAANILNHRELLVNAVSNGYPSAGAWYDSKVELPNEIMMYGAYVHTPAGNGTTVPYRYTINKTQLALMRIYPRFINPHRQNQWLRDVVSGTVFAYVYGRGCTASDNASYSLGVRPVFGVVG